MFALVDGNNYYASVERIFRPDLMGVPVAVLSGNDGCCIARSDEAKALGIKMGQPWFEVKHLVETEGLVGLSANFTLYGDISDRMMSIAAGLGHRQEVYSIDECFVDLTGIKGDMTLRAQAVRERILQWVGIPTCIGIGSTKTLAKLANHIAKTADRKPGSYPAHMAKVCNLKTLSPADRKAAYAATDLGEVWGIGGRIAAQLKEAGLSTAFDVMKLDPAIVRARFSVTLERTVRELQGVPCIAFEELAANKKEIACTRSFGHKVTAYDDLREAISEFCSNAAQKLRAQSSLANQVLVFIRTSPFRKNEMQYSRSIVVPLRAPTADTTHIAQAAIQGLRQIYRIGYNYAKAGVMLLDLQDQTKVQTELELDEGILDRPDVMASMDKLNQHYGRGTVLLASTGTEGAHRAWATRQDRRTPRYTTHWDELAMVKA